MFYPPFEDLLEVCLSEEIVRTIFVLSVLPHLQVLSAKVGLICQDQLLSLVLGF